MKKIRVRIFVPTFLFLLGAGSLTARTFTDLKGRRLEAELIGVSNDAAKVRRPDGVEFTLPLATLSEADCEFVRKWDEERRARLAEKAPKPGETLTFDFPDLPKDFRGQPAACKVQIPAGYDPAKPVGLMIFLPGGEGGSGPGGASRLTKEDFVCAGLPYPEDGRNPAQNNMVGDFDKVWKYWQPMLAKLSETVPNLDPRLRVIGGFSNGGHAIDGVLGEANFAKFFTAFFLIEGGGALPSRYSEARGKHCYVAWGEKSSAALNSEEVVRRAKRAGMIVVQSPMADTGHAFPESERQKVIDWLYKTVIPAATGK